MLSVQAENTRIEYFCKHFEKRIFCSHKRIFFLCLKTCAHVISSTSTHIHATLVQLDAAVVESFSSQRFAPFVENDFVLLLPFTHTHTHTHTHTTHTQTLKIFSSCFCPFLSPYPLPFFYTLQFFYFFISCSPSPFFLPWLPFCTNF